MQQNEVVMKKSRIYLRRSAKYEPIITQIERLAAQNSGSQLTATLMSVLELGLKAHDAGLRLVDDMLININDGVTKMNVDREVARSVFTSLAGSLVDLGRYEKTKDQPEQSKLDFYKLSAKALFVKHADFSDFTDSDVENVFAEIAPILKGIRLAPSKQVMEEIAENNKSVLQRLIGETGVML